LQKRLVASISGFSQSAGYIISSSKLWLCVAIQFPAAHWDKRLRGSASHSQLAMDCLSGLLTITRFGMQSQKEAERHALGTVHLYPLEVETPEEAQIAHY
jgi:hypothetical protein